MASHTSLQRYVKVRSLFALLLLTLFVVFFYSNPASYFLTWAVQRRRVQMKPTSNRSSRGIIFTPARPDSVAGRPARQLVFRGDTNNHFVAVSCNYGVLSAVIQLVVPGNITRETYLVTFRTRVVQKAAKKHSSMDG